LAHTTVTNADITTIDGNLGISPGTSLTDAGDLTINGFTDINDGAAANGQSLLTAALAYALTPTGTEPADLGGVTVGPGVYTPTTGAAFDIPSGETLYLDAGTLGAAAVFVFKATGELSMESGASIVLEDGASACNVFFLVTAGEAVFGTDTTVNGNILAYAQVTVATGATVDGRLESSTAQVTLDGNTISGCTCPAPP
jgi:type VI secretion system secreted protein VgrG